LGGATREEIQPDSETPQVDPGVCRADQDSLGLSLVPKSLGLSLVPKSLGLTLVPKSFRLILVPKSQRLNFCP
jgi:hypothetical protein